MLVDLRKTVAVWLSAFVAYDSGRDFCYTMPLGLGLSLTSASHSGVRMFGIGLPELILIFVLALLVLGPQRLPEVARMIGRAYGQLRRASEEFQRTIRQDIAAMERQEDANRNKAVAEEIRERFAGLEEVQTTIKEHDPHG